jgi:formamidopyrimidine-DNA glycosylase
VIRVTVRERRLRWPIPKDFEARIEGLVVRGVERRAKYILLRFDTGTVILHLGMSGSLRVLPTGAATLAHDHWDIELEGGALLRFHDPRRFGSLHWTEADPQLHPLLAKLAPEPLSPTFDADYLFRRTRGRGVAIKLLLMNSQLVVGVGNIYASEALFRARLSPRRAAGGLARAQCAALVAAVRAVLSEAIEVGGTTLRDYVDADGVPGYFRQRLYVYERAGEPCRICATPIKQVVQAARSTYWCPACQGPRRRQSGELSAAAPRFKPGGVA